MTLSGYQPFLS